MYKLKIKPWKKPGAINARNENIRLQTGVQ